MPLPAVLIGTLIGVGVTGLGLGIGGVAASASASNEIDAANARNEYNIHKLKDSEEKRDSSMDKLGRKELEVLSSLDKQRKLLELLELKHGKLQGEKNANQIPKYSLEEICNVSAKATVFLNSLGSAAAGTAGGVAAVGAATAIVSAFGTASTGTAIVSLSGAAATNAVLAAFGGGSIAAGGMGIAGGTAVLGGIATGAFLYAGGLAMLLSGLDASEKASSATRQVNETEKKINQAIKFNETLKALADEYFVSLDKVHNIFQKYLGQFSNHSATRRDAEILLNSVRILYHMCTVRLIKQVEPIQNGKSYYISPACAEQNVLDVSGASSNNGTNIQSYKNYKASNQRFITERTSDGYFVLRDEHSGKVLDVDYGIAENGRRIQLWEFNGSSAQLWKLLPAENGHFNICSKINENYCIDIPNATSNSGVAVHLWTRNGTNAQNFEFVMSESDSNHADDTLNTINYSNAKEAQQKADAFTNTIDA